MNRKRASLVIAGLIVSANSYAVTSAQPVRQSRAESNEQRAESRGQRANHSAAEVEILVNGTPQKRYAHEGRWYVEAIKGREYAIRLRNPYPVRVAVALAVDGLNTIDARHTAASTARKWVIEPYQTITISGWQTSRTEARRFEFTTEEQSYGKALGETTNLGIITAVFFKERVPAIVRESPRVSEGRRAPAPAAAAQAGQGIADADSLRKLDEQEHAATGMGRRTDHAVTEVRMDLEETPVDSVNIRYEYRRQLVWLGILPGTPIPDPMQRRERARGFEPGFSPEPPRR
jgi:hypothetical protein